MEKHIIIPPPDTEALIGIIAHHLGQDLNAIVEQCAVNSAGLAENSMDDVPDGTPVNSAINNTCSNIHNASPIVDKIVAKDQKRARNGTAHD